MRYANHAELVADTNVSDIEAKVEATTNIPGLLLLRRVEDHFDQRKTALRAINDRLVDLGIDPGLDTLGVRAYKTEWACEVDGPEATGVIEVPPDDTRLVPDIQPVRDGLANGDLQRVSWRGGVSETARTEVSESVSECESDSEADAAG